MNRVGLAGIWLIVFLIAPLVFAGEIAHFSAPVDTFVVPHFRMTYEQGVSREHVRSIADKLEFIFGDFSEKTALRMPKVVPVMVLSSFQGMKRRFSEGGTLPVLFSRDTLYVVSWEDAGYQQTKILPTLKYAVAYAVLNGCSAFSTPRWLLFGFALRYSGMGAGILPPPIAYMRSIEDFGEEERQFFDPSQAGDYSYLLLKTIDFLINRYGEQKFLSLFTIMRMDKTVEQGFEAAFGEKYIVIEKAWRSYIDTQVGTPPRKKAEPATPQEK